MGPRRLFLGMSCVLLAVAVATPASTTDTTPDRFRADESRQAMFEEPVDYVVPRQELDQFLASNPGLGVNSDVVIEVDYSDVQVARPAELPTDVDDLSAEEVVAIANAGGPMAAELDTRLADLELAGRGDGARPCAVPPPADPSRDTIIYLPCGTSIPDVTAVYRSVTYSGRDEEVDEVVSQVLAGPNASERSHGLIGLVDPESPPLVSTRLTEGQVVVDFQDGVADLGLGSSAGSAAFLDAMVTSLLEVDYVGAVSFSIDGSCTRFAELVEASECITHERRS